MTVIVENMEMPKSCNVCRMVGYTPAKQWCCFASIPMIRISEDELNKRRHPRCPLKECK